MDELEKLSIWRLITPGSAPRSVSPAVFFVAKYFENKLERILKTVLETRMPIRIVLSENL